MGIEKLPVEKNILFFERNQKIAKK